jgi:hypothetical protein
MMDGQEKVMLGGKWEHHRLQTTKKFTRLIKIGKALEKDSEEAFNFGSY